MRVIITVVYIFLIVLSPAYAMAYVGPGLGAGAISLVLSVILSLAIALFALIWYPFKRLLKKLTKSIQQE